VVLAGGDQALGNRGPGVTQIALTLDGIGATRDGLPGDRHLTVGEVVAGDDRLRHGAAGFARVNEHKVVKPDLGAGRDPNRYWR
jgi:hypothetical protein